MHIADLYIGVRVIWPAFSKIRIWMVRVINGDDVYIVRDNGQLRQSRVAAEWPDPTCVWRLRHARARAALWRRS